MGKEKGVLLMTDIQFMKALLFLCIILAAAALFILKSLYDIFSFKPKDIGIEHEEHDPKKTP